MTKFFKKSQKPYFAAILGQNEYYWKKGLVQFFNTPIIYYRAKNQKKLMTHSSEKCRTDR